MSLKCDFEACRKVFKDQNKFTVHMNRHLNIKDFKCDQNGCEAGFVTSYHLQRHQLTVHKIRPKKSVVRKSVNDSTVEKPKRSVAKRETVVEKGSDVSSDEKKTTQRRRSIKRSAKGVKTDDADYEVKERFRCLFKNCGKTFRGRNELNRHNSSAHKDERPHECEYEDCDKSFFTKDKLVRHVNDVHKKLKPFKCDVGGCDMAFARKDKFDKHYKKHRNKGTKR